MKRCFKFIMIFIIAIGIVFTTSVNLNNLCCRRVRTNSNGSLLDKIVAARISELREELKNSRNSYDMAAAVIELAQLGVRDDFVMKELVNIVISPHPASYYTFGLPAFQCLETIGRDPVIENELWRFAISPNHDIAIRAVISLQELGYDMKAGDHIVIISKSSHLVYNPQEPSYVIRGEQLLAGLLLHNANTDRKFVANPDDYAVIMETSFFVDEILRFLQESARRDAVFKGFLEKEDFKDDLYTKILVNIAGLYHSLDPLSQQRLEAGLYYILAGE